MYKRYFDEIILRLLWGTASKSFVLQREKIYIIYAETRDETKQIERPSERNK